ncbi:MAG TPA: DUF3311 domain-containing protein [Streptosporangiaceae bacterium]|jgi:hypothetical protein|nr:DUF3311 domain-containing protein [Streptosporangiaceae bacterium]
MTHEPSAGEPSAGEPSAGEPRARMRNRWVLVLLLVPLVATLIPAFYNFTAPSIGGMPFFYWWQLLWVGGVAACTAIVYLATRRAR